MRLNWLAGSRDKSIFLLILACFLFVKQVILLVSLFGFLINSLNLLNKIIKDLSLFDLGLVRSGFNNQR